MVSWNYRTSDWFPSGALIQETLQTKDQLSHKTSAAALQTRTSKAETKSTVHNSANCYGFEVSNLYWLTSLYTPSCCLFFEHTLFIWVAFIHCFFSTSKVVLSKEMRSTVSRIHNSFDSTWLVFGDALFPIRTCTKFLRRLQELLRKKYCYNLATGKWGRIYAVWKNQHIFCRETKVNGSYLVTAWSTPGLKNL